jgi:hypothetical protein
MDDEHVVSDWNLEETRNMRDFVPASYVSWVETRVAAQYRFEV